MSLYRAAPLLAHWITTITCGAGASGNGYDTATGNTFGSSTVTTFVWLGSTYTNHQIIQDSSHALKLTFKPPTASIDDNWSITINGHLTLNASDATTTTVARYGATATEYTWANQQPGLIPSTGTVTVTLNRDVVRQLPEGGTTGQVPTIQTDGVTVAWQTPAAGPPGPGQTTPTTYQALTNTPTAVGTENQFDVWNASGQLVHTDLTTLLGRVSNPGRLVVWVKPSTGPGSQYSDTISRGVVLPADYLSYDLIVWETASTSADYLAGNITDHRIWPTNLLGSASKSPDVDGSRVDWSAGNRTLSAGNTPTGSSGLCSFGVRDQPVRWEPPALPARVGGPT